MTRSARESRFLVHLSSPLLAAMLAGSFLTTLPLIDGISHPAAAQVSVRADFRAALEPYGSWERSACWGDVWVPDNRPRGWRPYTVGRWVYTDDWGWYWASDQGEDAWGWIVYHYGRWAFDPDLGWVWVPGEEWGPGFVQWRRGAEYIGWAPLPPDEQVEYDYRDQPDVWVFVRAHDFTAPRIETVVLPERDSTRFVRETEVVNRTVELRDRRFAVNPGIPAEIVAAAVGRPIPSFEVRPRVLAGTSRIAGATQVRADQLGRGRANFRESLRETTREIAPATRIAQPQPLGRNERGRLGANPPRAAASPAQPSATQGRGTPQQQPPRTQSLAPRNQPPGRPQQRGNNPPTTPRTQGLAPRNQPPGPTPPRTQGLAPPNQPQAPRVQEQHPPQVQQRPPQVQLPPRTQGLGGPGPSAAPPRPAAPPAATQGRGGGPGGSRREP
jgi:hypothetical protein